MVRGKVGIAGVVALLIFSSGCTSLRQWCRQDFKVGPNYCRPEAPVAGAWIDAGASGLKGGSADDSHWWTVFNDPTLNRFVEAAYHQNLSLRAAGLRILEARAELGIATGNLFPQQQEMTGHYTRNQLSSNAFPFGQFPIKKSYSDWMVGFDAAWELDFWGRFRRAIEAADAALDAQVENYDDVLVILQSEVAANYLQMRAFEERIDLARTNTDLQTRTLKIVNLRYTKGMVTELDLQRAKATLAITESLIPTLEIGHRRARNRLCTLLGMPPRDLDEWLGAAGRIPVTPVEVVVGIPADLLRRRPDVRRAEREAATQSARIGIAEAEFYPHIAITGNIGLEAEQFGDLFRGNSMAGSIGPSFRWNILNYGRILNNVRAQDARFLEAVVNYQETVLRANEEAENAIVAFLREMERAKTLDEGAQATDRAAEIAVFQYERGLVDYQPVLDTQRDLVRQQDSLAESRGQVAVNLVAVYKALAGGWQMRLAPPPAEASVVNNASPPRPAS